jgi:hypothetical protein
MGGKGTRFILLGVLAPLPVGLQRGAVALCKGAQLRRARRAVIEHHRFPPTQHHSRRGAQSRHRQARRCDCQRGCRHQSGCRRQRVAGREEGQHQTPKREGSIALRTLGTKNGETLATKGTNHCAKWGWMQPELAFWQGRLRKIRSTYRGVSNKGPVGQGLGPFF